MPSDVHNLRTIITYCALIEDAIKTFGNDENEFLQNRHYSNSCAFSLIQIGECVKRLSPAVTDEYTQIEWSDLAKFRDLIAHQYNNIDLNAVWYSITNEIPALSIECQRIIDDLENKYD